MPDDYHLAGLRGKTAEEVLQVTSQAATHMYQMQMAQQQAATQAPPANPVEEIDDEALIDGKALKKMLAAMQSPSGPDPAMAQQVASLNLGMARSRDPKVFERYGDEIQMELGRLPAHLQTLENLEAIVTLVKGRHVEDIANERAKELASNRTLSVRTTGAAPGYPGAGSGDPASLESDQLPAEYRDLLKKKGITEATAREFCRVNDMTMKQFVDSATKMKGLIGEGYDE